MTDTYLARYHAGDREGVWEELRALGSGARDAATHADARAVAVETMRRARENVELLATRLRAMGFRFAYPDRVHVPPNAVLLARLDAIERAAGPLPLSIRAFYEEVGSVCFMGAHPRLAGYAGRTDPHELVEATSRALEASASGSSPTAPPRSPVPPEAREVLHALLGPSAGRAHETLGGAMSLGKELMRRVGELQEEAARLMHSGDAPSDRFLSHQRLADELERQMRARACAATAGHELASDPLVIWAPARDELEYYRDLGDPDAPDSLDEDGWNGRYTLEIAPDASLKSGYSGGACYQVGFPDAAADAPVRELGAPSFVGYLRECFRWGGFPGLAGMPDPPLEELAALTDGLHRI